MREWTIISATMKAGRATMRRPQYRAEMQTDRRYRQIRQPSPTGEAATMLSDKNNQSKFPGSAANANCALRTLRRMLHKAEEWKVIGHAPKIKMMKEHGRTFGWTMKRKGN
jgi:hypothetical protein